MNMLKIDVSTLKEGKNYLKDYVEKPNFNVSFDNYVRCNYLKYDLIIDNIRESYILNGNIDYELVLICDRCGDEYNKSFSLSLEVYFTTNEVLISDDSDNLLLIKDDMIDLLDIFRENVTLNIPMKSICKEECLGLCLKCGGNISKNECKCNINNKKKNDNNKKNNLDESDVNQLWQEQLKFIKEKLERKK